MTDCTKCELHCAMHLDARAGSVVSGPEILVLLHLAHKILESLLKDFGIHPRVPLLAIVEWPPGLGGVTVETFCQEAFGLRYLSSTTC